MEKLKEQQSTLVANVSGRLEQVLESKISGLKETTNANREIINCQNDTLNSLLKRFENSSKKSMTKLLKGLNTFISKLLFLVIFFNILFLSDVTTSSNFCLFNSSMNCS